jgi:hypothetical protein
MFLDWEGGREREEIQPPPKHNPSTEFKYLCKINEHKYSLMQ